MTKRLGSLATALLLSVSLPAAAESLVPGPGAPGYDAALASKADGFQRQLHAIITPTLGFGLEAFVSVPANRALIDAFLASGSSDFQAQSGKHPYEVVDAYGEWGDLGMFGGVQAAGDAFRYATLRDGGAPAAEVDLARQHLLGAMQGLHWVQQITGMPGVFARGIRRVTPAAGDPPVPDPAPVTTPLFDSGGNPLPANKEPTWRNDFSGQLPFLVWLDDTSKDQFIGYVMALGAIYDVASSDPSIPASALDPLIADAQALGERLMEKVPVSGAQQADIVLMDADGRPTTFHDLSAEEVVSGVVLPTAINGFNALLALGGIRTLYHITGDPKLEQFYYDDLVVKRSYYDAIESSVSLMYTGTNTNYSNVNMAFVAVYGLLRYEGDPILAGRARDILENDLYAPGKPRQAKGLKQAFFDFIYAGFRKAGTTGAGQVARSDGLEMMGEHPSAPYWDVAVENCDPTEISQSACSGIDGTPITLDTAQGWGGSLVATAPVPMSIRPPSNFEWRSDPHQVNGAGSSRLNPGGDFHAAYWLGRLLEAKSDVAPNISPIARNVPGAGGAAGAGGQSGSPGSGAGSGAAGAPGGAAGDGTGGHANTPSEESGCGCHVPARRAPAPALLLVLALVGLARRTRR
jgi:hypothetical protein